MFKSGESDGLLFTQSASSLTRAREGLGSHTTKFLSIGETTLLDQELA